MEIIQFNNNQIFKHLSHFVVTIGMFDGVHIGHKAIIENLISSSKKVDAIPVVITFDQHPRLVLQHDADSIKLLSSQNEKFKLLTSLGVQKVIVIPFTQDFANRSASEFVQEYLVDKLHIRGLILGYDNHFGNKQKDDFLSVFNLAKQHHFFTETVEALTYQNITVSSTQIRKALQEGNIQTANNMLGYEYSFNGIVAEGEKVGRTLGFPTANLKLTNNLKAFPKQGVYVVRIEYDNQFFGGMMSIGIRPTFGTFSQTIEVHLFDFSENIYGKDIRVYVVDHIRNEEKFNNIDELITQLNNDKQKSLKILYP